MDVLIQAAQFILSLSILIILHEFGHFLPAKLFKTRVEKFYLFFNPWFSLVKKKIGGTVYGIGWLPLGGYVKISGMIDESMDKEQMQRPPEPHEFRSKPAWQRLIIMIGGVTVNAILGVFIFAMVLYTWGEEYLPAKNLTYGIAVIDSVGHRMGLQDGDKIVAVGNEELERFNQLTYNLVINEAESIQVDRNGEKVDLSIPEGTIRNLTSNKISSFAVPRFPIYVDSIMANMPAAQSGLESGDQIIGIEGRTTYYWHEFQMAKSELEKERVELTVLRNGDTITIETAMQDKGIIGFSARQVLDTDTITYSLASSFPAGLRKAKNTFVDYVKQIGLIFTSDEIKASESVGGFISIGSIFSPEWNWYRFWTMTAWLSIILAFMNLLPIPALDGGHVMFLLWEIVTGREPNQKVLEYAQIVGMVLLVGLLLFANGSDVIRLFK